MGTGLLPKLRDELRCSYTTGLVFLLKWPLSASYDLGNNITSSKAVFMKPQRAHEGIIQDHSAIGPSVILGIGLVRP